MKSNKEKKGKIFSLGSDHDLVTIRKYGKGLAARMGFDKNNRTLISTAISEICRNVIEYAGQGRVKIEISDDEKNCIMITISDSGPGIEDVSKALQEGYTTGKGLGVGLPGAKRIMDEFEVQTCVGEGTTIRMCKRLGLDSD